MKVLFLDHDGVICLSSEFGSRFKNSEGLDSMFDRFNNKAIKVLNDIIRETDCEIVVSSDWKYHSNFSQLQELYKIRGILKSPIDCTPFYLYPEDYDEIEFNPKYDLEQNRSLEIKRWLRLHPDVTNWVAVDDLNMNGENFRWGLKNFVHTPFIREGIKQSGVKDKIIKFLNENPNL